LFYHNILGNARLLSLIVVLGAIDYSGGLSVIPKDKIFGLVSQASSLGQTAIVNGIVILSVMGPLGQNNGRLSRICQLLNKMKTILHGGFDKSEIATGTEIEFQDVVCVTPTGKVLNQYGVSVKVPQKDSLILMGPSGSGKSSLLRALAGLWPIAKGKTVLPKQSLFLPQKPYMVIGRLCDQVVYPNTTQNISYDELQKTLERVNLGYLLKRFNWDAKELWNTVLSPGEQQRLCMARLFYHRPTYAILDESTSALDVENEDAMYDMCKQLGIGLVSVGHRDSLLQHHNILLNLDGKGGWALYMRGQSI